jgi:hypothetical protein
VVSNVRLVARALGSLPLLVVLNRFDRDDEVHRRSLDWLRDVDGLTVVADLASAADHLVALAA